MCPAIPTPAGLFRGSHEIMFVKVICSLEVCMHLFIGQICIKHLCAQPYARHWEMTENKMDKVN